MRALLRRAALLPALLGFALCFAAPERAGAVLTFTDQNVVLVSSMVPLSVVPISTGGYRMYLSSGGYQILSATSTDMVDWTLEGGVRLATSSTAGLDSSSITACGVIFSTSPNTDLRMFYVGVSSVGFYSILSATSADGLVWFKESTVTLQVNGGLGFIDSPAPIRFDTTAMRLFYIADNTGINDSDNYRIFSASSTDNGVTFVEEGEVLSGKQAFQVSVTTLTDARTRIYYSAPLSGGTTVSTVVSAASTNGLTFSTESDVRLSTTPTLASLTHPVVMRSTETFRWRMFFAYTPGSSTIPYTSRAITLHPAITNIDPSSVLKTGTNISVTITGEMFSTSPSATFTIGTATMNVTGITRTNNLELKGTINPFGQNTGMWDLNVSNADGNAGYLASALNILVPPGEVTIVDNLFRPRTGGSAQVTVKTFETGRIVIKLYSSEGGLIQTLLDEELAEGSHQVSWNGRTSIGNTVASGVYLLSVEGPATKTIERIVVIK